MQRPDFILIGAMKCGTSTLATQLGLQKGIFMTTPKEPNFFSDDAIYAHGPEWYEALFKAAAPHQLKGEASTHYTKLPTYPATLERMLRMLPDLKLVYMIRHPVNRAVSHYMHEWSEGHMSSDAAQAFEQASEIIDYGRYGMQIAPFVQAYGADRIHLTSLEQITMDPAGEFARITDFLGASGSAWIEDLPAQNISAERVRRLPMQHILVDNAVATALRRALVPKSMRRWVRKQRSMTTRPEVPDDLRARMQHSFLQDREALAVHFPAHPALELCYPFATP